MVKSIACLFLNSQKGMSFKFYSFFGEISQCRISRAFLPLFDSCLRVDSCHLGNATVKPVLVNNENRIPFQTIPIHFSEQFL